MKSWKKIVASAFALFALADLPAHASAIGEIEMRPSSKATYVCISPKFTPIASATDMWEIYGSSTKTVKILQIDVCFTSGSLVSNEFYLIKRSTANSSGTPTTPTIVALDSNNSAATAVVKHYASGSNPTLGTAVGNVCAVTTQPTFSATYQLSHSIQAGYQTLFDAKQAGQALTLRGTSQGVVLNNNGVTLPGSGQIVVRVIWTEE